MRRLSPTVRSFFIHSGQAGALLVTAGLAMAAAPTPPLHSAAHDHSRPVSPPVTAVAEPAGPVTRSISFTTPVRGHAVNSAFGLRRLAGEAAARRHDGVDIAAPQGTGVYVAGEGRVTRTGFDPDGYGRFVEVRHPNGMSTLYGHLSRVDVATGQAMDAGERIGLVGSTGRSTGPHLHFEVRRGDRLVDPQRVLNQSFEVRLDA